MYIIEFLFHDDNLLPRLWTGPGPGNAPYLILSETENLPDTQTLHKAIVSHIHDMYWPRKAGSVTKTVAVSAKDNPTAHYYLYNGSGHQVARGHWTLTKYPKECGVCGTIRRDGLSFCPTARCAGRKFGD